MTAATEPERLVAAARALAGARAVPLSGSRALVVEAGEVAVVAEGAVEVYYVPGDGDGNERPRFVCELAPGDVATGASWRTAGLGLPPGTGELRAVGAAEVVVAGAPPGSGEPLAAAGGVWEERVAAFARDGQAPAPADELARLGLKQAREAELVAEAEQDFVRVFEARRVGLRPAGLPATAAALADAAAAAGLELEPRRLELVRDTPPVADVLELAGQLRVPVRRVSLEPRWWRAGGPPLLAFRDGRPLCLVARRRRYAVRTDDGRDSPLTPGVAGAIDPVAYAVYPTLPPRPLRPRDLVRVGMRGVRRPLALAAALTVVIAALGVVVPYAIGHIIGVIIPSGLGDSLTATLAAVGAFAVAGLVASIVQALSLVVVSARASADLTGAVWDRLLHLPPSFFRGRPAGQLAQQATAVDQMRSLFGASLVAALGSSALSLAAIGLLFWYSLGIGLVVLGVVVVAAGIGLLIVARQADWLERTVQERNRLNGVLLGLFWGIAKLRVAGAERRAHALWAHGYARQQEAQRRASLERVRLTVLQGLLPGAALTGVLLGAAAFASDTASLTDFTGSVAAAGQLAAAAASILALASTLMHLRPLYRSAAPILEATPEVREAVVFPGEVAGAIELDRVTFGYTEELPILDEVSLRVPAGSFVAIVGPSGAGKSTILRLILGFEDPWEGQVLLDGKPLDRLDVEAVRRQFGTVIQGARIMSGPVLVNILGSLPLGIDAAWEAAELAGIADEIRALPMQMQTVVSEGGSGFSGGQLQRLLLARALVRKPRVVLLDEATSALDNTTQAVVSESLERLGVTRLVVAHRLSTVRDADSIVVVDRGRVAEQGSYEELVAQGGLFARLAARQT